MFASVSDTQSWAHRLPAGAKFAALLVLTAVVLVLRSPWVLLGVAAVTFLLFLSCGPAIMRAGWRMLRVFLIVAGVIGLWHLLTSTPEAAARIVLQLLIAVALAVFVTLSTRLEDMLALFRRALAVIGLPEALRGQIALAMALAIRFVPVLGQKAALLRESWRARSRRRFSPRLVLPLALLAIDDAEAVAEALRARRAGP